MFQILRKVTYTQGVWEQDSENILSPKSYSSLGLILTLLYYLKSDDVKFIRIRQNNTLKQIIFNLIQIIQFRFLMLLKISKKFPSLTKICESELVEIRLNSMKCFSEKGYSFLLIFKDALYKILKIYILTFRSYYRNSMQKPFEGSRELVRLMSQFVML